MSKTKCGWGQDTVQGSHIYCTSLEKHVSIWSPSCVWMMEDEHDVLQTKKEVFEHWWYEHKENKPAWKPVMKKSRSNISKVHELLSHSLKLQWCRRAGKRSKPYQDRHQTSIWKVFAFCDWGLRKIMITGEKKVTVNSRFLTEVVLIVTVCDGRL